MFYTNTVECGGDLESEINTQIINAEKVIIASGYVSLDVIERYADSFERIVNKGGSVKVLVGMAFYEGLNQKKLNRLIALSDSLRKINSESGVYVPYKRKFHGKIYNLDGKQNNNYYLGSSNFSTSGLIGNMEATAQINDRETIALISNYIAYLFSPMVSETIDKLDIIVPGSKKYQQRISAKSLEGLRKFDPHAINISALDYFDLNLEKYASMQKSSLNVYFGEGRLNRSTGIITPRPWFEAALIATAETIRNPLYPRGDFDAYTDDGFIIPMSANGANNKNIQSRGSLIPFGMWIKNKLQKSGALKPLTPFTIDVLETYGRSSIRFYKISEGKYFMDFSNDNPISDSTIDLESEE